MKLSRVRREYEQRLKTMKQAIREEIAKLPDNPKIQRLAKNCFVIRSGDLGNNWTPEYHDWIRQYELASSLLDHADFRCGIKNLIHVIRKGKLRLRKGMTAGRFGSDYIVHFAPEVRKNLRRVYLGVNGNSE